MARHFPESQVQPAVFRRQGRFFDRIVPYAKFFLESATPIWQQIFLKLDWWSEATHMRHVSLASRQRPQHSVSPIGSPIWQFFSRKCDRSYAIYFPVKRGPIGLTFLKKYVIILKKDIITDRGTGQRQIFLFSPQNFNRPSNLQMYLNR